MKYYKITNKTECHKGMQYQDGLNTDIMRFNPTGNCNPGGIYFARKDILAFLGYGCWLREVTLLKKEKVYKNPGNPVKWKAHQVFLGPRRLITAQVIEELIKEGATVKPRGDMDSPVLWAIQGNQPEALKVLLNHGGQLLVDDHLEALEVAIGSQDQDLIRLLVKKGVNIHMRGEHALQLAAKQPNPNDLIAFLITMGADINKATAYCHIYDYRYQWKVLTDYKRNTEKQVTELKDKKTVNRATLIRWGLWAVGIAGLTAYFFFA